MSNLELLKKKITAVEENFIKFKVLCDGVCVELKGQIIKDKDCYFAEVMRFKTDSKFTLTQIQTLDSKDNVLDEMYCRWPYLAGDLVYFTRELLNVR